MATIRLLLLSSFIVLITCIYTNKQARACIDLIPQNKICAAKLKDCFSNQQCIQQYETYEACRIDDDEQIFNGFCFRQWFEKAVHTKQVIDCLVSACNLTSNSKYSIKKFYDCSRAVLQAYGDDLDCSGDCMKDLAKMKVCLEELPYDVCYDLKREVYQNEKAYKILSDVKIMCLEHSTGKIKEIVQDQANEASLEL